MAPDRFEQVARLGDQWRTLARRRRMRRRVAALALAAGIVLAVGLAVRYRQQEPAGSDRPLPTLAERLRRKTASWRHAGRRQVAASPAPSPAAVPTAVPTAAPAGAALESREPTLHERMALLAVRAGRRHVDGDGGQTDGGRRRWPGGSIEKLPDVSSRQ